MNKAVWGALVGIALATALMLRVVALDRKPMHHDEANQAVRFGQLLETGHYAYDRADHHGPTLYYLTWPLARLRGQSTLASLDERTLRLVPAIFGTALILLYLPLVAGLGRTAIAVSAWLTALSPALTYYSRAYIQEMVFAFFALAFLVALGRFAERPRPAAALLAGVCGGLAYATKETSVIVIPAAIVAVLGAGWWRGAEWPRWRPRDLTLGVGAGVAVAVVLYSSFFTNPAGFVDSIRAFGVYVQRGLGASPRLEAWDYYWRILAFSKSGGLFWSEAFILVLALVGVSTAFGRRFGGFWPSVLALYSVISAAVFSAIPYKTPWNLVPFYVGVVLMAGVGAAALWRLAGSRAARGLALAFFVVGCGHLGVESWRASLVYPADPRNPYVYAQTVPDFLRLVGRVQGLAAVHPDHDAMLVGVLAGPYEQWPLPWYLRRMGRIGYWTSEGDLAAVAQADVIVVSQEHAGAAERALGVRCVSEFYGLRPDVVLTLYVDRELWIRYLAARAGPPAG